MTPPDRAGQSRGRQGVPWPVDNDMSSPLPESHHSAATTIQKEWRRKSNLSLQEIREYQIEFAAATRIQAVWRGSNSPTLKEFQDAEQRSIAAILIQAAGRGHLARHSRGLTPMKSPTDADSVRRGSLSPSDARRSLSAAINDETETKV